ncbi:bifunctional folylpolyglutamate synthase/dihydrofolate synthase [Paenibacillus alginolyticus]|uniref:tetrahydrofolate synthase n=2 Tax=Paenibacillus alginolyticus TaxID=59839 RepID=A0ABT4GDL9_9BACL|nr:folylpolyglutamate synthase/dihydrofolate synthase family protein [Paenibacillus alginolyticus]MCY9663775.1 bifunctional folylpolyglutamate synthase/dihydrofolate synthase [Paenibacillus alginolyticus]MCY9694286.1 bifunctional folylpolyglutamate synthase/dihydrofolate synthase [Paenibacillus alginolyticus]MEC0142836.1 bifunctional folylpolyglutamate synthase/dihydrofolate synthase [Paenibacillus alginolyticus]
MRSMDKIKDTPSAEFQTAQEAIAWIVGRMEKLGIKPGLQRMQMLMEKLGHPERRLKFIHVAGTNGKGSTCAYLSSVLQACGYDVGTFTSPYLEKYTNRIQVNGADIPDDVLLTLVNDVKPIVDEIAETEVGPPSMFEISTALAIMYFGKVAYPDYVVWETGLGGRLDSTNIVNPVVTIITNVGHDHMEILGDTLELVAAEKAGIIKAGVPVITAAQPHEVWSVIDQTAKAKKATLYSLGGQFNFSNVTSELDSQTFDFSGPFRNINGMPITLNGEHQLKNAAVAVMTLEVLRQYYACIVDDEDLFKGLKETRWPGRLEMVSSEPRILLDGAHNPEGAATLAAALQSVYTYRKLHMMVGMLSTKNHTGYLRHILPLVDTLIITEPDFHKKGDASMLAEIARELLSEMNRTVDIIIERDWKQALETLTSRTEQDDLAVVSGTLYLISDVRSWITYQTDSEKGW